MLMPSPAAIHCIIPSNTILPFSAWLKPRLPEALPELPSVGDFVPGYESSQWYGIGVTKNTPREIVDKLNQEINAALAAPKIKARLADLGGTVLPLSPSDFGKLIADETEKWGKVIRAANIKAQ
jgi:tripartite-type tricarboxylate transporter receptor subunit TctC